MIKYDFSSFGPKINISKYQSVIDNISYKLTNDQMTDWFKIDKCINFEELNKIIEIGNDIITNYDVLIVVGIGGSYLGSEAVINALNPYFKKNKPEIIFAGNSLSSNYIKDLISYIENKNIAINVISKSGDTLETSVTFGLLLDYMEKKYSKEELQKRIIITTDKEEGTLRRLVNENGYRSLVVPSGIGGRFSVLTSVGLLPIYVAGIDIKKILSGANNVNKDKAYEYAIIRHELYNQGKVLESFTIYEPKLYYFTEWLKQLFAETQGKENKGIMPISSVNTRDLHSLGQYYQQGQKIIFETVIGINKTEEVFVSKYNKTLDEINNTALISVCEAHLENSINSNLIILDKLNEENIGEMIYFFEIVAAVGGYLLNINPFDQPGVKRYKEILNSKLKSNS